MSNSVGGEAPPGYSGQEEVPPPRRAGLLFGIVRRVEVIARAVLAALERLDWAILRPWLRLARNREFWRFVRFLAVGGVNFAFSYSVFLTVFFLGGGPIGAVVISWVLGVLFNFATTGRVVFGSGKLHLLPRFIGVYVVQLGVNIALLNALLSIGLSAPVAQALAIIVLAVVTFLALRRFVFAPHLVARQAQ